MHTAPVQIILPGVDQLGEGPIWDDETQRLLRVDIANGLVHSWDPVRGEAEATNVGAEVSAVLPRAAGAGWVLAIGHDLVLFDLAGRRTLAAVERDRPDNRFNDCKCDPLGHLWAGTMSKTRTPGAAALYRVDPDGGIEPAVTDTTISNGLGWSPSGDTMYFVDSLTYRVDAFDFDGTISGRRPLAEIDPADGLPDGLAVDAEGGIWLCLFGGGALRRYAPDGTLEAHIPLPVTNPTCPAFGGADLATLYVTSARHRLTAEQRAAEPLAGSLLALDPGVRGQPANRFAG